MHTPTSPPADWLAERVHNAAAPGLAPAPAAWPFATLTPQQIAQRQAQEAAMRRGELLDVASWFGGQR